MFRKIIAFLASRKRSDARATADRIRWRLCWWIMPRVKVAQEKRRLEEIARASGCTKAQSVAVASNYFNHLQKDMK